MLGPLRGENRGETQATLEAPLGAPQGVMREPNVVGQLPERCSQIAPSSRFRQCQELIRPFWPEFVHLLIGPNSGHDRLSLDGFEADVARIAQNWPELGVYS